jgi:hypothetical protein
MGVGLACSIFAGVRPVAFSLYDLRLFLEFIATRGVDFAVLVIHTKFPFPAHQTITAASQLFAYAAGIQYFRDAILLKSYLFG